jgi:hypothetical protein
LYPIAVELLDAAVVASAPEPIKVLLLPVVVLPDAYP